MNGYTKSAHSLEDVDESPSPSPPAQPTTPATATSAATETAAPSTPSAAFRLNGGTKYASHHSTTISTSSSGSDKNDHLTGE